jgi:hypothetical protein
MAACVLCGEQDGRRLIAPCLCNKKDEDAGRWHLECLRQHLASFEADRRPGCPVCQQAYRVALTERFALSWGSCLSSRSLGNVGEMCSMLVTFFFTVFAFTLIDWRKEAREGTEGAMWVLGLLSAVCFVLVLFTVKKIYERWREANSEVLISEV